MKSIAKELGTTLTNIQETNATNIQPWTIKQPELFLELNKLLKQNMHPHKFQDNFQGILENYADRPSSQIIFRYGYRFKDQKLYTVFQGLTVKYIKKNSNGSWRITNTRKSS